MVRFGQEQSIVYGSNELGPFILFAGERDNPNPKSENIEAYKEGVGGACVED